MPWIRNRPRQRARRPFLVRCYRRVKLYFLRDQRDYVRNWDRWAW